MSQPIVLNLNESDMSIVRSRLLRTAFACMAAVLLVACGGTKVYTVDKTVVHNQTIYNVSNVFVFSTRNQAVLSGDELVDLGGMDKRQFNSFLEANGGEVFVRQVFVFDDRDLVYQAQKVPSWKEFNKMNKRYESAAKKLRKFLGDKKETQLELK